MAARTISTRLVIEGESEYRQAVKNCSAELATMKSQLALVTSEYQNNANSAEALAAKGEALAAVYAKQQEKVRTMRAALENAKSAQTAYGSQVDEYKAKLAAAQARLDQFGSSSKDATKEQKKLADEIRDLTAKVEDASQKEAAAARGVSDWQKQVNYAQRDLNNLDVEIDTNRRYLQEAREAGHGYARSIDSTGKEVKKLDTALQDAGSSGKQFGKETTEAVDTLATALVASGVTESFQRIRNAILDCAKSASAFQAGMAEVYTLLPNLSRDSRESLAGDMLKFSAEMNVLTTDAVPALYQAISAGVPQENVFSFMETAQKAAVGGVTDLKTAVDGLTSIVNAYGAANINAEQTADILFTAVKLGKTDFQQLSGSIYNVVPTAASAGIAFEQVAAALAVITARGVPTSVATTQLRQMLVKLNDSGSEVAQTFEQVAGQSFRNFIGSGGNVQQALQILEKHGKDTNKTMQELFGEVEAGNAAMSLTGQATDSFTQALKAMSESSGAADTAYTTMAETAEYAQQRATVAFENLKTAIGEVLLPAFANLQNAAADGLFWATAFVEEHPGLVAAISGVAAALGVLAVGVAAYTVATKVAALATEAFNGALSKNPVGIVLIALSALVGAVTALGVGFSDAGDRSKASFRDMTSAAREAKKTIADSQKAYDDTAASTLATAEVARKYVVRLRELTAEGLDTAEAHAEYAGIVDQLNMLMPELNLEIDEQTGLIKGNTNAVLENIESLKQQAIEQAWQEKYSEQLKAYGEVQVEIEENEQRLEAARREETAAISEQEQVLEESAELFRQIEEQRASEIELYGEAITASAEYNEEYLNLVATAEAYGEQILNARDAQDDANRALEEGQEAAAACEEGLEEYTAAHEAAAEAAEENADKTADLNAALNDAQKAYDEVATKAQESIDKQIGQWEKMDTKTETSTEALNEALKSQIKYLDNYTANLSSLADRNVEGVDTLVQKLSDGSTESAAILAGLADASDDEIKEVVANLGKVEEGKKKFSGTVADLSAEFKATMDEVISQAEQYDEMYGNGADTMQGLINGVRSKKKALDDLMAEVARSMELTYKKENDQHSPSRKFEKLGKDTLQGAINGIKAKEGDLESTMKAAVDLAVEAFGEDNEEAVQLAQDFLDAYSDSLAMTADNAKIFADITQEELDRITDAMEEVEKKQEAMQKKLSEYGDLFTIDPKTKSMKLEDLDEQIATLNEYEATLSKLKENGISDGLLDEVVGMGVDEAIQYGQKLIQMYDNSPDKWEEYNSKWQEKQDTAKRIAQEFYQTELDTLKGEFNDELERGLDDLKMMTFDSGEDAMRGLIDGLRAKKSDLFAEAQSIANELQRIINSALNSSGGSKKNGSHALGIDYVPFDGYVAELHKGERVLTADETRAYIEARTPSSFDVPTLQQAAQQQTEALVNALGTLTAGVAESQGSDPATIILQTGEGIEIARWLLPSIREATAQSPEVERDF